jgi:hypothetical protein
MILNLVVVIIDTVICYYLDGFGYVGNCTSITSSFLCRVEIDRVSVLRHQEQVGVGQFELAPLLAAKLNRYDLQTRVLDVVHSIRLPLDSLIKAPRLAFS